jgi:hypothetical protein
VVSVVVQVLQNDIDLLNPPGELEKLKHKKKRFVQSPNSFFMVLLPTVFTKFFASCMLVIFILPCTCACPSFVTLQLRAMITLIESMLSTCYVCGSFTMLSLELVLIGTH